MGSAIIRTLALLLASAAPLGASEGLVANELAVPENVRWDDILRKVDPGITFGLNINGPSPYTRNNSAPFTPASNSKLFTAGAVLANFGANAVFVSKLSWQQAWTGDSSQITGLTLTGSGDPTWGMSAFGESLTTHADTFAKALYAEGVREVHGAITLVADDPRWNQLTYPQGWAEWARTECGTAQAQAFNLNLNCATYVVASAQHGYWLQSGVPVRVKLALKPGAHTTFDVEALDPAGKVSTAFVIKGTFQTGSKHHTLKLPIHDAAGWVKNLLIEALHRRGISTVTKPLPPGKERELIFSSPAFAEIFKPFLKHSVNMIGETYFKALGSKFGPPAIDLVQAGQVVLRKFVENLGSKAASTMGVAAQPGFYSTEARLFDGSGISRASEVTTSAVMALLLDLRASPDFSVLWDALPIAGVDGTLEHRMKDTPAAGVLRGKTGTLDGVYNLSGYVPRYSDVNVVAEFVPYVMLTRTTSDKVQAAHDAEDLLGAELARVVNTGAPLAATR